MRTSLRDSRRGFIRVDFDTGSKVAVSSPRDRHGEVSSEAFYDALDLCVYGLSFLANSEDASRFEVDMQIPLLAFTVKGRRIAVSGRVAYMRRGLAAGLAKVAVEFTNILVEDVWFLARYVAEKSGVNRPHELGSSPMELRELKAKSKRKPKKAKPKAKSKTKPKAKASKPKRPPFKSKKSPPKRRPKK